MRMYLLSIVTNFAVPSDPTTSLIKACTTAQLSVPLANETFIYTKSYQYETREIEIYYIEETAQPKSIFKNTARITFLLQHKCDLFADKTALIRIKRY